MMVSRLHFTSILNNYKLLNRAFVCYLIGYLPCLMTSFFPCKFPAEMKSSREAIFCMPRNVGDVEILNRFRYILYYLIFNVITIAYIKMRLLFATP